jgi:hypothetical protein
VPDQPGLLVKPETKAYRQKPGMPPGRRAGMAKGQKKSNREARKPKAEAPKKLNASNPSQKPGVVAGLDNMKRSS